MILDTHSAIKTLIETGLTENQAKTFVELANEKKLDTHLAVKKLMATGFTENQAEGLVKFICQIHK